MTEPALTMIDLDAVTAAVPASVERQEQDWHLIQGARRRHARVHAALPLGSGETVCAGCLREVTQAAEDLNMPSVWVALDSLYYSVRTMRRDRP